MTGVEIAGLGHYVPLRAVANAELEQKLNLQAGWIERRTGIRWRRYAASDEALSDLAVKAGQEALNAAQIAKDRVALLLLATSTPDHLLPPSAPLVAHRLGLTHAGGVDLAGACGGFVYALTLAESFVRYHDAPVLVIAGNILSRRINFDDRTSSVLFADAAGAALLVPSNRKEAGLLGASLRTSGTHYDLINIRSGGSRRPFSQANPAVETLMTIADGKAVYAKAIDMMTATAHAALEKARLTASDVAHFVPHQANARMMAAVAHKLEIPAERMASTVEDYANSSAATIPLTLSMHNARFRPGDHILMTAAGAGMIGGAAVWRW